MKKDETIGFNNLSLSDKYWAVTLDGKPTKTMYKDSLLVPAYSLAVALAEEWESHHESINLKTLHLVRLVSPLIEIEQFLGKVYAMLF